MSRMLQRVSRRKMLVVIRLGVTLIVTGTFAACAVEPYGYGEVGYGGDFYEPYGYEYGGWGDGYRVGPPRGGERGGDGRGGGPGGGGRPGGGGPAGGRGGGSGHGGGAPSIPGGARGGGGHGGGGHH